MKCPGSAFGWKMRRGRSMLAKMWLEGRKVPGTAPRPSSSVIAQPPTRTRRPAFKPLFMQFGLPQLTRSSHHCQPRQHAHPSPRQLVTPASPSTISNSPHPPESLSSSLSLPPFHCACATSARPVIKYSPEQLCRSLNNWKA